MCFFAAPPWVDLAHERKAEAEERSLFRMASVSYTAAAAATPLVRSLLVVPRSLRAAPSFLDRAASWRPSWPTLGVSGVLTTLAWTPDSFWEALWLTVPKSKVGGRAAG